MNNQPHKTDKSCLQDLGFFVVAIFLFWLGLKFGIATMNILFNKP